METFALSLHPQETRLIEYGRVAAENRKRRGLGKPETFTFLGFAQICGRTHRGKFLLERKTRRDRMRAKLKAIKAQLRLKMHEPIPAQGRWLGQIVRGYFAYHAIPTNSRPFPRSNTMSPTLWRRTLSRRSQGGYVTWETTLRLVTPWLPMPRVSHPGPISDSPSNTRGGSRVRKLRPLGSGRGARRDACPYRDRGPSKSLELHDDHLGTCLVKDREVHSMRPLIDGDDVRVRG